MRRVEAQSVTTQQSAFARGEAAFASGDFAAALDYFLAARAGGTGSAAVEYNIAVCQYRLARYNDAERSFRALALDYSAFSDLADYNLGLVYLAQGRAAEAHAQFERVSRSADLTISNLATAALNRSGARADARDGGWTRFADFSFGHDSNVALLEDSVLSGSAENESPFVEAIGFASGVLSSAKLWRIEASGYGVSYSDTPQFNQVAIAAAGLRAFAAGDWRFDIGPRVAAGMLDGDGFERRLGIRFNAARDVATGGAVRMQIEADQVDRISERFAFVEGDRRLVDLGYSVAAGSGQLLLGASLESNDRVDPGVSADRERFWIAYRFPVTPQWSGDAILFVRNSDYADLLQPRSERLREIGFTARRDLRSGWQLSASARISDNDSSDPFYDYSRTRVSIGLSRPFPGQL